VIRLPWRRTRQPLPLRKGPLHTSGVTSATATRLCPPGLRLTYYHLLLCPAFCLPVFSILRSLHCTYTYLRCFPLGFGLARESATGMLLRLLSFPLLKHLGVLSIVHLALVPNTTYEFSTRCSEGLLFVPFSFLDLFCRCFVIFYIG
jgi:hypothetical protein